jgi:hypothetical protein
MADTKKKNLITPPSGNPFTKRVPFNHPALQIKKSFFTTPKFTAAFRTQFKGGK